MNDKDLRQYIIEELDFEPSIDSANIGVSVDGGIVTLTGHVTSYVEKLAVEAAVKRIKGVLALAEEIEVRYPEQKKLADDQIAKRAVDIISWDVQLPDQSIQVKVSDGRITLSGEVDWHYQKLAAEASVRKLSGVRGVHNLIRIRGGSKAVDVQQRIVSALRRTAELESRNIQVTVDDGKVTLTGNVKAWHERQLAEQAAWAAAGVREVVDNLRFA
jgi:osmotically-inducible protein OsmY